MTVRKVDFPEPPDRYDRNYFLRFVGQMKSYLSYTLDKRAAVDEFYLLSPAGKIYRVTVSDAGVLTTTHVQG